MAFDFNPITGQLDLVGGGSSYIDGVVADSSLLPVTLGTPALDAVYLAKAGSGVWLINRKPAGLYCRTANNGVAADWTYLGAFPEVNSSTNWELYDGTDPTKELKFDLSGISTGTVRTITMPDANVTLPDQGTSTGDSPTFAQVTINDTVNEVSTLTLADTSYNNIEFAAQELTLRHTGAADTPYINVTDGTDYALLGVRQGDMFLQGSNAVVRIEKTGGGLADIKVNKLVLEDATTAGDPTATFDADGNLTASRTYDLPDASGTIALTSNFAAPPAIGNTTPNSGAFTALSANNGTVTANTPALNVSQTWSSAVVGFRAFTLDVTTISAANTAMLAEFLHNGTSRFRFTPAGTLDVTTDGGFNSGAAGINIGNGGSFRMNNQIELYTATGGILEQRRAANAQTFRLYTTYASTTSFERLSLRGQTTNNFIIATEKGTTGGAARGLELQTDSVTRLTLGDAGGVTIADANNIAVGTTTGTKIGTATTQKIGFFNATPVVQQAAIADATDAATTQARLNDLLATMRTFGLIAT